MYTEEQAESLNKFREALLVVLTEHQDEIRALRQVILEGKGHAADTLPEALRRVKKDSISDRLATLIPRF